KTATGTIVYSETFKVTASSAGIFTIVLGKGTYASGVSSIANIDWANGPFFLNLKIAVEPTVPTASWNVNNEYVDLGTSQFWSVPYALYAGNVKGADTKLNITDTAAMLKPYFTSINLKANIESPTFTGTVSGITKAMVGLGNVDNTADINKPVSTTTQAALDLKVDKVTGKELSTNDYTTAEKTKLAAITGTNTGDQINITGNAATATTAGNITATANTTLTSLSSLTSVGTIASLKTGAITNSGKVIVGASSAASASAVLEASSTTQGFLPPRMTYAQMQGIASPATGLVVFCTNCGTTESVGGELEVYSGGIWRSMIGNAATVPNPTIAATTAATSITSTTAISGGNITSDGGSPITARGVVWSTSADPTTSDSKTTDAGTTGTFTSNLTGLTAGTLYYVRSYATNAVNTVYGTQISFTT
ncbi:MAG: hypothetical protein ACOVOV_13115, partial [Dolichospermum sp.]